MKGQITVFVVVGLIVLVSLGLLIALRGDGEIEIRTPNQEKAKIKEYVTQCLETTSEKGAILIGAQGGKLNPDIFAKTDNIDISYGYYQGSNILATREQMETELGSYIDASLKKCIEKFPWTVKTEDPSSRVKIDEERITVVTKFPVEFNGEREENYLLSFVAGLGKMHSIASKIIIETDPDWIDLSYLSRFPVDINVIPLDEETMIYYMVDKQNYLFAFASKYIINQEPILEIPDVLVLDDGMPWLYQVNCTDPEDDPIIVSEDTAMLDTLQDGSILSTPEVPGSYNVTFTCEDNHVNKVQKKVLIVVR